MRLCKKAAACLLAAVMAVSMLTACGGDAGSTADVAESKKTETSSSSERNDDKTEDESASGSEKKDDSNVEKPVRIPFSNIEESKTYQFLSKLESGDEYYIETNTVYYDIRGTNKVITSEEEHVEAHKGNREYSRTSNEKRTTALLIENISDDTRISYVLFEDDKAAIKSVIEGQKGSPEEYQYMYKTKTQVEGKEYNSEVFITKDERYTYCLDEMNNPKFVLGEYKKPDSRITAYFTKTYQSIQHTSNGLCQIPNDYTIYTTESFPNATKIVDEDGNQYTYNRLKNKVYDAEGNDVTKQFVWFIKYVKL